MGGKWCNMKTLHIFSDAGDAWAKVKKTLLHDLGIAEKITACSYQYGDYAYLEEDCDLETFLVAYFGGEIPKNWSDQLKQVIHYSNYSRIRNYAHYSSKIAPKLSEGTKFSLYGENFTAINYTGKNWRAESEKSGIIYKIKKSQLGEIEERKGE